MRNKTDLEGRAINFHTENDEYEGRYEGYVTSIEHEIKIVHRHENYEGCFRLRRIALGFIKERLGKNICDPAKVKSLGKKISYDLPLF